MNRGIKRGWIFYNLTFVLSVMLAFSGIADAAKTA